MQYLLGTLIFLTSLFLIMLVLVQRGRGGGLAGAFGGMGGQSAFGTKAGDLFTRITIIVAAVWILLSIAAIKLLNQSQSPFGQSSGSAFTEPGINAVPGGPTGTGAAGTGAAGAGASGATGSESLKAEASEQESTVPGSGSEQKTAPAGATSTGVDKPAGPPAASPGEPPAGSEKAAVQE